MNLLRTFVKRYPWQSLMLVTALLLAGLADGIGLSAMLPLLQIAFNSDPTGAADDTFGPAVENDSEFAATVTELLTTLGISPTMGILLSIIVTVIAFKNLLIFFSESRIGYIAANIATELRMDLLRSIVASRWQYFVNQSTGALANSMATEAWRASNAYIYAVKVLVLVIEASVYTSVAVLVSWRATLICFAASAIILSGSHFLVRISHRAGKRQTHAYRSLLGRLTDVLQSVKTFKAMGRVGVAEDVLALETRELKRALKREVLGNSALESIQEPMFAVLIAVGIYIALVGFGVEIATVTFLVLVLARLIRQLGKVQKQYQRMMTCESAYWALQETIANAASQAETARGEQAPSLEQGIDLDRVSFAYGDHTILEDVSMHIPASGLTLLIGDSGSGKTTIADLVIGLVQPDAGAVRIDGQSLAEIDLHAWRHRIGYVPQDNLLLHDSVLRNVTLGDDSLSQDDAINALKAADAWEFVSQQPEGIHALVGERGTRLSGGQRQRIMIARALAHHPRLLILDEATSALDPATEAEICRTLAGLKQDLTVLAVTHQAALGNVADRIYRLNNAGVERVDPENFGLRATASP